MADQTAEEADLPYATVAAIHWTDATAALVRGRLAATLADAIERDPRTRDPANEIAKAKRKPKQVLRQNALADARRSTQHRVAADVERDIDDVCDELERNLKCLRCGTTATIGDELVWLQSPCVVPTASPFCPEAAAPPAGTRAKVGSRLIHETHKPQNVRELAIWICTACGANAASLLRALAAPCNVAHGIPRTRGGDLALAAVARGMKPGCSAAAKAYNAKKASYRPRAPPRSTRRAGRGGSSASQVLAHRTDAPGRGGTPMPPPVSHDADDNSDARASSASGAEDDGRARAPSDAEAKKADTTAGMVNPLFGQAPSQPASLHLQRMRSYHAACGPSAASSSTTPRDMAAGTLRFPPPAATPLTPQACPTAVPPVEQELGYVSLDAVGIPCGDLLPCVVGNLAQHHDIASDNDSSSTDSVLAEQRGDTVAARRRRATSTPTVAATAPIHAPSQHDIAEPLITDPHNLFQGMDTSSWVTQEVEDAVDILELGGAWSLDVTPSMAKAWLAATREHHGRLEYASASLP